MKKYVICLLFTLLVLFISGCEIISKDNIENQFEEISNYLEEQVPDIVTNDLDLVKEYSKYNAIIEWRSSNTYVLDNNGKMWIADGKAYEIMLTYTMKINDREKTKDLPIVVSSFTIDQISQLFKDQFLGQIKNDLIIENTFLDIFKITWSSNNTTVFNNEGKYLSPDEECTVNISYYISCNNYKSEMFNFDIQVCGKEYKVKVVNGLINNNLTEIIIEANEEITIKANKKENYDFQRWTNSKGETISTEEEVTLKVTQSDTYIANYERQPIYHKVTVKNGLINNEASSGSYQENSVIKLTADNIEGYVFTNWTDATGKVVSQLKSFDLKVSGANTYTANYEKEIKYYSISVVNGKINYYSTSGKYEENISILLTADEKSGYNFINWTDKYGNIISNNKSINVKVTKDNIYTANYKEITYFNIIVINGLINGSETSGKYPENTSITVKATKKTGYNFVNWTDVNGNIVSINETFTIKITESNSYTANYKEKEKIIINEHNETIEASYDSTLSKLSLPSTIQIKNNNQTYNISVKWNINNFIEKKIGKQEFTGEVIDNSVLLENNIEIKLIKLCINVLPYTLELNTNKTYTITGYYGNEEKVEIPNTFNNIAITNIAQKAFNENLSIKELIIPNTIKLIEQGAIYFCNNIESITIPFIGRSSDDHTIFGYIFGSNDYNTQKNYVPLDLERVVLLEGPSKISGLAFYECSTIKTIDLPSTVKTIEHAAFYSCKSLIDFEIPEGVTQLGDRAFAGCSSLEKVTIPKGVTVISNQLFAECTKLKEIIIHNEVTNIELQAFRDCTSLMYIEIPESVLSIASGVFSRCESLASVKLPSKLRYIESVLFSSCKSLKNIEIPVSVMMIDKRAFWDCESLTEITIPKNVTIIGEDAFYGCENLRIVTNESSFNFICESKDYGWVAYYAYKVENKGVTNYKYGTKSYEFIIKDDFKFLYHDNIYDTLDYYLISYMGSEERPIIPAQINGNLYSCKYMDETLKIIELSKEFVTIHYLMFDRCKFLESVVIPDSVITIEGWAFYSCDSLKEIIIPNTVKNIKNDALCYCSNLTIYCASPSKPLEWSNYWNPNNCPVIWGYNTNN